MIDVLGLGIANICYVLNPEIVVLGGGIMAQVDYLENKIQKAVELYSLNNGNAGRFLSFQKQPLTNGKDYCVNTAPAGLRG